MLLNSFSSKLRAKFALIAIPLLTSLLLAFSNVLIAAPIVDLKVLVISTGTAEQDQGLDLIDDMLDEIGVPYDVLNARETELSQDILVTNNKGNYNGIILTDSFLYYTGPGNYMSSALTLEEWKRLHAYERDYGVRESVLSGYPASGAYFKINYDLDYGMDLSTIEAGNSFNGVWQLPNENKELFEYVNRSNTFPITDYSRAAHPSNDPNGPVVTPLLTDADSGKALVSKLVYADGREVLLSTITNAWYLIHSQVLNYEFLNFATQGVFIGSRKVYLAAHIDDLFLPNEIWDPETNTTTGEITYRNTPRDIWNLVFANKIFQYRNPNFANFKLDMVFNGEGADLENDRLTKVVVAKKNHFRFINHTYSHRDMYKSSGATYDVAYDEIYNNLEAWQDLGLPDFNPAYQVLVTGNHSGLEDTESSNHASSFFTDYPEGVNIELMWAMEDLGIHYMASDASRPNQGTPHYVQDTSILLLPRYPTAVFYNVTTPAELTDEYNYIFYERYLENGEDPCTIPGAICQPRSYQEILAVEADTTLRHMLTYRPWPHFFHISNLRNYGNGATLQYDWLYAVSEQYNALLDLPVINMDFYNIGVMTQEKLKAKQANIQGYWNRDQDTITITADEPVMTTVTGADGGENYGGQKILKVSVGNYNRTLKVDRAID